MIKKNSVFALILPIVAGLSLACFNFEVLAVEQIKPGPVFAETRYSFSIPAGSLRDAIKAIEKETGLAVTSSKALKGKATTGLFGQYTAVEALQQVLQAHNLQLQHRSMGRYSIVAGDAAKTVQLPSALIIATAETPSVKVFDQLDMRSGLRNDMAEALSMVPSIRVSDTASSSLQQGDLKPAEFSIRGAATYQNKIMLDGASIDNMLDPANQESQSNYTSVAGHSQSVFIDPRFVKELKVIDVNASAAEGNFTGGVVKAETQSYDGYDTFAISQRRTQDSWTNFHVDKKELEEFSDGAAQSPTGLPGAFQPKFKKSETALSGATRLGDLGVFVGYSEKQARIKQKQLAKLDFDHFFATGQLFKTGEEKSLDRHSRYAVIRTDLLERDYELNASLAYSDYSEDSFVMNYLDSDFSGEHNGLNLSVNFAQMLGATKMDLNINGGISADERNFKRNVLDQYNKASPYGEGIIGGYGELANNQHSFGSTLGFATPLNDSITFKYGGEFKWSAYQQDRTNDFIYNEYHLDTTPPLPPQTSPGYWPLEAHYQSSETTYGKGKIKFTNLNLASYAELEGEHDRFFWRSGLRLERDGWLKNTNMAPRLLLGVYLDKNKTYQATLGANRYYGKSFLSYRLREKELRYRTKRTYDKNTDSWNTVDNSQK